MLRIYIYNVCDNNDFNRADDCLYEEMELAYREERAVDKIASEYLSQITYGGDLSNKSHMKWGFGKFIATDVTVAGDYSMVQVREVSYTKSVVLYCFAFGLLWTIGVFVVILVKKING